MHPLRPWLAPLGQGPVGVHGSGPVRLPAGGGGGARGGERRGSLSTSAEDLLLIARGGRTVDPAHVLRDKYVGVLFSASWSPPCNKFTQWLGAAYEELKKSRDDVELVFCSGDLNEAGYQDSRRRMAWLAVPYRDRAIGLLRRRFRVRDIPALVWLDPRGTIITRDGAAMVQEDVAGVDFPWRPKNLATVLDDSTRLVVPREGEGKGSEDGAALVESNPREIKLRDNLVLGLYFAAGWCDTCALVTPVIRSAYDKLRKCGHRFEVLYVHSDRDKAQFEKHASSMPWPAVAYDDPHVRVLLNKFRVQALPALALVDATCGRVITANGVGLLEDDPDCVAFPWRVRELSHSGSADIDYVPALVILLDGLTKEDAGAKDATVTALRGVAEELTSRWSEEAKESGVDTEEVPLLFAWGDEKHPQTSFVRRACSVRKQVAPVMLILDVAEQVEAVWSHSGTGRFPTADDIRTFAESFLDGSLTMGPVSKRK